MKDEFPEAKGKKEITMKTLMETIWKSSACLVILSLEKKPGTQERKNITRGREFYFNFLKYVGKKVII